MPFSNTAVKETKAGIGRALASGKLNKWEYTFLLNMLSKLNRHGGKAVMTEKQHGKMKHIIARFPETNNDAQRRAKPQYRRQYRHKPKWWSPYWFFRGLRRDLIMAGAIVLAGVLYLGFQDLSGTFQGAGVSLPLNASQVLSARDIRVIDGDTINVRGEARNYRLVGFNTPETKSAECTRERELGYQAAQRLEELIGAASKIDLDQVRCACKPGTEGTESCNYGRLCGALSVDGVSVGSTLISEGLAAEYICGATSCPPRTGSWCN